MNDLWNKNSGTLIVAGIITVFGLGALLLLTLSGTGNTTVTQRDLTEQPVNIYTQPSTCSTAILRSWWGQVDSRIDRYQAEMQPDPSGVGSADSEIIVD